MARVEWHLPRRQFNGMIAGMPGVQQEVRIKAGQIAVIARSLLESKPKKRTGKAQIQIHRVREDKYGDIDWFVSLVDPTNERWPHGNAKAIEFGHYMGREGQPNRPYIKGLYIMSDTFALSLGT